MLRRRRLEVRLHPHPQVVELTVLRQLLQPAHLPPMLRRRRLEVRLHPHPLVVELTVLRRQPKARR
jgi:hypothetical protein